ncbi:hypothetical protein BJ138DRAFT_1098985 [Hygrophoropsis aurantiaca]|uniref:Uncharacterized protein n=1 Tax=Hygrophoropsis aurantiaca TaxID=72124 RepID=A0ACB8AN68_9AGAM|nr:hypothetical protein BJ138DRAFT_1098985 [Hygrophoropsis aurantiaca]
MPDGWIEDSSIRGLPHDLRKARDALSALIRVLVLAGRALSFGRTWMSGNTSCAYMLSMIATITAITPDVHDPRAGALIFRLPLGINGTPNPRSHLCSNERLGPDAAIDFDIRVANGTLFSINLALLISCFNFKARYECIITAARNDSNEGLHFRIRPKAVQHSASGVSVPGFVGDGRRNTQVPGLTYFQIQNSNSTSGLRYTSEAGGIGYDDYDGIPIIAMPTVVIPV